MDSAKLRNKSRGVILLNLGTPEDPGSHSVKKYLKEFLMDPYVLDIPYLFRWLLVHVAILPRRPALSALAYQKIWTEKGSPLLVHLLALTQRVQEKIGSEWSVQPAMRYGSPSIRSALQELKKQGLTEILVVPMYPQYSLAATESSIQECIRIGRLVDPTAKLSFIDSFYEYPLFIQAFVSIIQENLKTYSYDHLLFSFHGLPERHIQKASPKSAGCLVNSTCCDEMRWENQKCYRAQCFASARLMAGGLGVSSENYTVSFQSRLGRTPWIRPYTDVLYRELPRRGIQRLAVVCPAFVADCLETLEEIQIRGKEEYLQNGGEDLKLVPSLNSSEIWVNALCELLQRPHQVAFRPNSPVLNH